MVRLNVAGNRLGAQPTATPTREISEPLFQIVLNASDKERTRVGHRRQRLCCSSDCMIQESQHDIGLFAFNDAPQTRNGALHPQGGRWQELPAALMNGDTLAQI